MKIKDLLSFMDKTALLVITKGKKIIFDGQANEVDATLLDSPVKKIGAYELYDACLLAVVA